MAREIKFRAWDKKGRGFINGFNMVGFCTGQGAPKRKLQRYGDEWDVDDVILEQYTGRNDKNHKESYHHDIVKSKHYGVGEIVWQGNGWVVICSGMAYSLNYGFVIIGNRHQHAKFLEGKT